MTILLHILFELFCWGCALYYMFEYYNKNKAKFFLWLTLFVLYAPVLIADVARLYIKYCL